MLSDFGLGLALALGVSLLAAAAPQTLTTATMGDDHLQLIVSAEADGSVVETFSVDGVPMPYRGEPGAMSIDDSPWQGLAGSARIVQASDANGRITVEGVQDGIVWRATYETTGPGLITKSLSLEPDRDLVLSRVAAAAFQTDASPEVASTSLQDIAAFLREGDRGMFVSLDFPYSRITQEGKATRVTYPPNDLVESGKSYACHTVTFGATRLTGEVRFGRDTGEVAAMDAYVQTHASPRFDRPMYVGACINNRYTMPEAGRVWYTYKDHPTLSFHHDLFRRELDLMPEIGMEYYQVFPGIFDWVDGDPDPTAVKELVAYGNARGVRLGDYSGCNSVFCAHYNEYSRTLEEPEWRMRDANGGMGGFCFGCPEFAAYYRETVTASARRYGFEIHCFDFLGIAPCYADHGHPGGDDGVYHQVRGLVSIMEGLNAVDPDMMVWSNSGNWSELLPKIVWANPNVYLTDPYIATPWAGLNMTRLLDDARREQMVGLHYQRFAPYRNYTNCQYFFSQNSIVPDVRNYQYGALATLAVTPNLCLAEVRPWMDRLPSAQQDEVKAFYSRWTSLVREHYGLWTQTYHVGDDPRPGGVEVYSHAAGGHGFVFVVNPNYWSVVTEAPLDERLGFSAERACEVRRLHPSEQWELTSAGPTPAYGTTLRVEVPAQQVLVFEVQPAAARIDVPRVYGIPARVEESEDGWVLATSGPQGSAARFAVRSPEDELPLTLATVRADMPKQAKRLYADTPLRALGQNGVYALFEVTFRRASAPTELRTWTAQAASGSDGDAQGWTQGFQGTQVHLPLSTNGSAVSTPLSTFLGAYIDNAFSEMQPTWIVLRAGDPLPEVPIEAAPGPAADPATEATLSDQAASWWLQTDFHLPFMYTIGAEPAFDEHTVLVLPMTDPSRAVQLRAWVNGVPLDVRRYAYPRNRGLSTWWATLVGTGAHGGDNRLVVHVEFAPGAGG